MNTQATALPKTDEPEEKPAVINIEVVASELADAGLRVLAAVRQRDPRIRTISLHWSHDEGATPRLVWDLHAAGICVVSQPALGDGIRAIAAKMGSPADMAARKRADAARLLVEAARLLAEADKLAPAASPAAA